MKRVLFVCLGNICRSPTAEGVMRHLLVERGLEEQIEVDSAGTGAWHVGQPPDRRMREAAERRDIRLAGAARQVEPGELAGWDLVVAMDGDNLESLERHAGDGVDLRLFSEFLPPGAPRDVPDPYYGGPEGFDRVIDLVEEGCPRIVEHLLGSGAGAEPDAGARPDPGAGPGTGPRQG